MNYEINPFQELYVTDRPDPGAFVRLFSDFPVKHASALFSPGNVVLKGTQGSGKSMLLNLLKPEIRLAYAEADQKFPIKAPSSKFIGAGINLTRSGILDIGQRPLSSDKTLDEQLFPLYFADFLNYFVVRDLLDSLTLIEKHPLVFGDIVKPASLDNFAQQLSRNPCWFGALEGCSSFLQLCAMLEHRIVIYRKFHQYNATLDESVSSTKTTIGEPIATTAECLKQCAVISNDVSVFIRIDQIERLYRSDILRKSLGHQYRKIINKALSTRDSRVSYRIGTRRYAWEDDLVVYGTEDQLEHLRDFRIIDLDATLRRRENASTWVFPDFAKDAFAKRLKQIEVNLDGDRDPLLRVFGETPGPETFAKDYAGNTDYARICKIEEHWPHAWKIYLKSLYDESPLEAALAAAWVRQRGSTKSATSRLDHAPPKKDRPWQKTYWRKERVRHALLLIAARSAQRLKWYGKDHILALSAGNISTFLSICHEIWDTMLRSERRKSPRERYDPERLKMNADVQAVGIQVASFYWYNKIPEQPKGESRQRLIKVLGPLFRSLLVNDESMSYPGRNGFSLATKDLDSAPSIKTFLAEAVDFGDLYDSAHTTKDKDREPRIKYYLNPTLSDFFQIPEAHVKEPYYAKLNDILTWLQKADVVDPYGELFKPLPIASPKAKPDYDNGFELPLF